MSDPSAEPIAEAMRSSARISEAMRRAAHDAMRQHALAGKPIAVWENNQVVWKQPAEVLAFLEKESAKPAA
jgi:hypothetical protein